MPFPDSIDDKLLVDGQNLRTTKDYTIEAINGARIDLNGLVYINGALVGWSGIADGDKGDIVVP